MKGRNTGDFSFFWEGLARRIFQNLSFFSLSLIYKTFTIRFKFAYIFMLNCKLWKGIPFRKGIQ